MKKAIIIGATSGIGQEVAGILVQQGWRIGIAGRREEVLRSMQQANPQQIEIQHLDVTKENAVLHLTELIDRLGGMDLFFLSSGVGYQNRNLEPEIELNTARTNVEGFIRMVTAAFDYFKKTKNGHIAVISSIAGTKGLDTAFSYFKNNEADTWLSSVRLPELKVWELPLPILQRSAFRIHTSMLWHNSHGCSILISASPTSVRGS